MSLRLAFRRKPVWHFDGVRDIDGDAMLHVRVWDLFESRWRWEWSADHIPPRVMASLSVAERDQIRRLLRGAP